MLLTTTKQAITLNIKKSYLLVFKMDLLQQRIHYYSNLSHLAQRSILRNNITLFVLNKRSTFLFKTFVLYHFIRFYPGGGSKKPEFPKITSSLNKPLHNSSKAPFNNSTQEANTKPITGLQPYKNNYTSIKEKYQNFDTNRYKVSHRIQGNIPSNQNTNTLPNTTTTLVNNNTVNPQHNVNSNTNDNQNPLQVDSNVNPNQNDNNNSPVNTSTLSNTTTSSSSSIPLDTKGEQPLDSNITQKQLIEQGIALGLLKYSETKEIINDSKSCGDLRMTKQGYKIYKMINIQSDNPKSLEENPKLHGLEDYFVGLLKVHSHSLLLMPYQDHLVLSIFQDKYFVLGFFTSENSQDTIFLSSTQPISENMLKGQYLKILPRILLVDKNDLELHSKGNNYVNEPIIKERLNHIFKDINISQSIIYNSLNSSFKTKDLQEMIDFYNNLPKPKPKYINPLDIAYHKEKEKVKQEKSEQNKKKQKEESTKLKQSKTNETTNTTEDS